jgi:hypothetical protein
LIHWSGKGYLAIVVPIATAAIGMALNGVAFQNGLSNNQINGPSLVVAALVLQYLVRRFPSLRMREEGLPDSPELKPSSPYFIEVEPLSERLIRFLKVKRHAPHTLFWIPLSIYPYILGGIGVSQLLTVR